MAFDVEAAKADGYTDEEIQQYLNTKEIPVEQPLNRGEEAMGTIEASLPQAAIYAGEGAALGYGAKALSNAFQNRAPTAAPVAPVAPTQPSPILNSQGQPMASAMPKQAPSMISNAQSIVQKLALDKVLKGAGIAAGAYQLGQGLFGTSPEEIAIMKEAEARKRAQGWKPMNER